MEEFTYESIGNYHNGGIWPFISGFNEWIKAQDAKPMG